MKPTSWQQIFIVMRTVIEKYLEKLLTLSNKECSVILVEDYNDDGNMCD